MSNYAYNRCDCCEVLFHYSSDLAHQNGYEDGYPTCAMCYHRQGLCQHNLFERVAAGGRNIQHSSKPCDKIGCEYIELVDGQIRRTREGSTRG